MRFSFSHAQHLYQSMFGTPIDIDVLVTAMHMSEASFEAAEPGCDPETGEYLDSPFSAGEYHAIRQSRNEHNR
jgi:hypothetical protein